MAAYAALNSVMYILQQIQHHPRPPITIQNQHMDSICEIISYLQDFLEKYSHRDIGECKEELESQIADAAYAAEDVIESHIVDQILANSNIHEGINCIDLFCRGVKKVIQTIAQIPNLCSPNHISKSLFCQDLQKAIEDMNLIKKEVMEIQEKLVGTQDDQLPRSIISMSANIIGASTVPFTKSKNTNTMVGFDDVLIQIMDRLTGHPPNRQVLPIVGMGGIGKTTLARNVYDHQYIMSQFDVRIWVTISQEYRLRDILLEALSCKKNCEINSREDELGLQLYKSLCGRRYLIILDDLWSIEGWEELMLFFPDNNNGSRIMITTRLSNVSNHFGSGGFKMDFLDEDKSWKLLCKIVFEQDQCCCPLELEKVGKKIARNCKGLPLSISVIGGLLANSEKTQQYWEYISENLNPIVNLDDGMKCWKILYLSYNHLPVHLKPCFLYMGVFPEDKKIAASSLKKLWVAEGFLKPIPAKSLEMVAEEYLKDLIDRNLILVDELGSTWKVKYCKIHDLLRDLCLREGKKDKFLWVGKVRDFDNLEGIQCQRRVSVHEGASYDYHIDRVLKAVQSASLARFVMLDYKSILTCKSTIELCPSLRLVRVFIMGRGAFAKWEEIVFTLVNSRYLDFKPSWRSNSMFPSSIHLPWNLQTLIISGDFRNVIISREFWKMSQLRHVDFLHSYEQCPPYVALNHEGNDEVILKNLQTLKGIINLRLSDEVIKRIPNIKKLQVSYHDLDNCCLHNLGLLNKLESLNIQWIMYSKRNFQIETIPHSLKKLTLSDTNLLWEHMRVIGSLPHLQVLKLKSNSFCGPEWNPFEGEFLCLKFLQIELSDLVYWNANRTHFPCLEQLHLCFVSLMKIPLDIGHIPTLRSIKLQRCSDYVVMSAYSLLKEQVELGNEDLQVQVQTSYEFGRNMIYRQGLWLRS